MMMSNGFRIIASPHFPMKHIADEIVPIHWHPLAIWFVRKVLRRATAGLYFMRGQARYEPTDPILDQSRGVIFCHPIHYDLLRRQAERQPS